VKQPRKYYLTHFLMLLILIPAILVTVPGCYGGSVTIQEDGSGRDCAGHYMSRGEVLREMGGCVGSTTFIFTSEQAYKNFMDWANGRVQGITDAGTRHAYEDTLRRIEHQRYPPGGSGVTALPAMTSGPPNATMLGVEGGGGSGGSGK
jgi:hypothetical protein